MMKCTFEGAFDLDPESKITYTSCGEVTKKEMF